MSDKKYTVNEIKEKLSTNKDWVERAIVVLFDYQTDQEKVHGVTQEEKGVGFTHADASFGTKCAKWIKSGKHLDGQFLEDAFRKMPKYARQLWKLIDEDRKAK